MPGYGSGKLITGVLAYSTADPDRALGWGSMPTAQALLLVDLQTAFLTGPGAVPGAETLTATIKGLLTCARAAGALVVHLQNDGEAGTPDEPGQPGWALHLSPEPGEPVVRKRHDDGFLGTDLGPILIRHQVIRIAIAGVMSEMCVSATARTALERGHSVILPHDAHATCDVPAGPGYDQVVPAAVVARVAEWSLGDQIELTATSSEVDFERPSAPAV